MYGRRVVFSQVIGVKPRRVILLELQQALPIYLMER
jgi:hypothetical protein